MKILVVDDEKGITSALSVILKKNNYLVDVANNGEDGLAFALSGLYDLIILDVMMPIMDGYQTLKAIRGKNLSTPVLMLSAKSETSDKIVGLNMGADDYLSKPFDTDELLARIKALLRRNAEFTGDLLEYNDISLDRNTYELIKDTHRISLGKKEFQILEMLIINKGKCIQKERFIEKIWGYETEAEYNTIEVYISFIRKKLLVLNSKTEIKSIRGVGYTLGEKDD